jgi:regulator of replication initiation timing
MERSATEQINNLAEEEQKDAGNRKLCIYLKQRFGAGEVRTQKLEAQNAKLRESLEDARAEIDKLKEEHEQKSAAKMELQRGLDKVKGLLDVCSDAYRSLKAKNEQLQQDLKVSEAKYVDTVHWLMAFNPSVVNARDDIYNRPGATGPNLYRELASQDQRVRERQDWVEYLEHEREQFLEQNQSLREENRNLQIRCRDLQVANESLMIELPRRYLNTINPTITTNRPKRSDLDSLAVQPDSGSSSPRSTPLYPEV